LALLVTVVDGDVADTRVDSVDENNAHFVGGHFFVVETHGITNGVVSVEPKAFWRKPHMEGTLERTAARLGEAFFLSDDLDAFIALEADIFSSGRVRRTTRCEL
jgi:hypothetical protein